MYVMHHQRRLMVGLPETIWKSVQGITLKVSELLQHSWLK